LRIGLGTACVTSDQPCDDRGCCYTYCIPSVGAARTSGWRARPADSTWGYLGLDTVRDLLEPAERAIRARIDLRAVPSKRRVVALCARLPGQLRIERSVRVAYTDNRSLRSVGSNLCLWPGRSVYQEGKLAPSACSGTRRCDGVPQSGRGLLLPGASCETEEPMATMRAVQVSGPRAVRDGGEADPEPGAGSVRIKCAPAASATAMPLAKEALPGFNIRACRARVGGIDAVGPGVVDGRRTAGRRGGTAGTRPLRPLPAGLLRLCDRSGDRHLV